MNEIKIFSNPQFGEIRTRGKHIYVRLVGDEEEFDEYDILTIVAKQDAEFFESTIKLLDALVPVENVTYFTLRCKVYQDKAAWRNQHDRAICHTNAKTYLMRDENTGCTKIGKSVNPRKRERTLLSDKPTITLFMVSERDVEKELHRKYKSKRIRGEWFNLSIRDINSIVKQYAFKRISSK